MRLTKRRFKRCWKRFKGSCKSMWRSQTLPRPRPVDGPPIPPRGAASTLSRNREVDVQRLREDIDTLSRQLRMVRAQLSGELSSREVRCRSYRDHSPDSRLSTTLFSPVSVRDTPTPLPTRNIVISESPPASRNSTMRRHSCFPGTKENYQPSTISMMSVTVPSASIMVPRVKRRETFSKADNKPQYRRSSLGPTRLLASESVGTFPPPKPVRTFAEKLDTCLQKRLSPTAPKPAALKKIDYEQHPVADIADLEGEELARLMCHKFQEGHCWFTKGDNILFINPFSNISGDNNHEPYQAIGNIVDSLLQLPASALVFRGVSGSGKSQLAEMACFDAARKLQVDGSAMAIFMATLCALRPLTTINSRRNNLSSRCVQHLELHHREGKIVRLRLKHFLLESPSRSSRANIFAMLASELKDSEKERLRLTGFYLREEYSSYGKLEDFKSALTTLGISVQDVFSVISAITLLNNLCFKEIKGYVDIENIGDLEDAAHLLGVSSLSLYRTLLNGSLSESTVVDAQKTRDELGAAAFSRLIFLIVSRANRMLDSMIDSADNSTSTFNDSGVSVGSQTASLFRIVDVPGYSKASNNSLTELLINTMNDSLDGRPSIEAKSLLEKIDQAYENKVTLSKTTCPVKHADGNFSVDYDLNKMVLKNCNTINKELIRLFDTRCCSFSFVNKLFATDLERLKDSSGSYSPRAVIFIKDDPTIIHSVLALATDLQNQMDDCEMKYLHCIKSNDKLEYSRVNDQFVTDQIVMLQSPATGSQLSISLMSPNTPLLHIDDNEAPSVPPPRSYELRDGRLHKFPQRRTMLVDHVDHVSGVTITAGEVVKAIGFKGECYLIETGQRFRAKVPISFTEKSLPPTEGFQV